MTFSWSAVRRWSWTLAKLLALAAVAGGIYYVVALAPVRVVPQVVERGEIVSEVLGTGTLEARIENTVSPKISGRMQAVLVDQGERVTGGQLLVQLDDDELSQQVAIAQAQLDAALAALERVKADKDRALAVASQAGKHHARVVKLAETNVTSLEDVDKAIEGLAVAEAGVSRAEAAITETQKELVAGEKTLEFHRTRLSDTRIVAPFDGLIVRRYRDRGDVVVPGTAVLTLVATEEMWIRAWVDETEMAGLDRGQAARVVFRSEPEKSYPGTVVRLGREADRETREFVVDVRVLELPRHWAVGQRAEVFIETARKDGAVIIPARFLSLQQRRPGVYLDQDGRARWRVVEIGLRGREQVEVVSGLQPGETIVMPADARRPLAEGRRIAAS